jgi:transcription antitermination factor NusG
MFTLQCWSSKEEEVKQLLLNLNESETTRGRIMDVHYPTAQVLRMRGCKVVVEEKRITGGFVFINARLSAVLRVRAHAACPLGIHATDLCLMAFA